MILPLVTAKPRSSWKPGPRTRSHDFLLAAIAPDESRFGELAAVDAGSLDWRWILDRATAHKVAALLASRIERCHAPLRVPDDARDRLDGARNVAGLRSLLAQRTLQRVGAAFERRGVPFLVLKGSALAEQVYGAAVRAPGDVDLLVAPGSVFEADRILRSLGYRPAEPYPGAARELGLTPAAGEERAPFQRRAVARRYKELHYLPPDATHLVVDLHWDLCNPRTLRRWPIDAWSRSTIATLAGTEVRVLDREAALVYLAVHALECDPWNRRLIHLADVAWHLGRYGSDLRPTHVRELARSWGAEVHLDRAVELIGDVLGVPVEKPLAARPERSVLRRICFVAMTGALVEEPPPPGSTRDLKHAGQRLVWRFGLRMPIGYELRQLVVFPVWRGLRPLLPRVVLDGLRRSRLLRRFVGVCE